MEQRERERERERETIIKSNKDGQSPILGVARPTVDNKNKRGRLLRAEQISFMNIGQF